VIGKSKATKRVPLATYRLQFNRDLGFQQAIEIAAYLNELGISDLYASPLFKATPDSTHGYDVCDYSQLNPNLGSSADFDALTQCLHKLGMGLLLDMVPNHMACNCANDWWLDVLARGPASPYADWFDINWRPLNPDLQKRVLLPVLEHHYASVLEAGKLKLVERGQPCPRDSEPLTRADKAVRAPCFSISYYDRTFPLSPETSEAVMRESTAHGLQATLARYNGTPGAPRSFDALHGLLERQHYRLAFWRTGREEINYRRFFDVPELVSLRMESPEVFQATHRLPLEWLQQGKVSGLRIDHPDGLWDPKQYLGWLQERASAGGVKPYLVVEKILSRDESLPEDWPVDGTTGYDFLNYVNRLFVDPANENALEGIYREFTGCRATFPAVARQGKKEVLQTSFISECHALAWMLKRIAAMSRYGKDFTFRQLATALEELIVALPVYRSYINSETRSLNESERGFVQQAFKHAAEAAPAIEPAIWDFLQNLFFLEPSEQMDTSGSKLCREFLMRFQQLSGPVMAKGVEDTAFYNYNRLISLNEVGGDPDEFGSDAQKFHAYNQRQAEHWPHSLVSTATHDTKRGEDVRARINVLSEIPDEWRRTVNAWRCVNADKKQLVDGAPAPAPNDEYLLYQTLIGVWPADSRCTQPEIRNLKSEIIERVSTYMVKALKESKAHTSWTEPNAAYEQATTNFVESVLDRSRENPFLAEFLPFQRKVSWFGQFNSLSQALLKLTSPGVPDFYQGTELWDFSLVDPDNRRPVDFELRRTLLTELTRGFDAGPSDRKQFLQRLLSDDRLGRSKLFLVWQTLQFLNKNARLFGEGSYVPLPVTGSNRDHVCAFARVLDGRAAVIIVPRFVATLTGGDMRPPIGSEVWQDTAVSLPQNPRASTYRNALTGELLESSPGGLSVHQALSSFPVALLLTRS